MKKFIKDFGTCLGIFSGAITINDYLNKKSALATELEAAKAELAKVTKLAEATELDRKIDMSALKLKVNNLSSDLSESYKIFNQAVDEKFKKGDTETYNFLKQKAQEGFGKVTNGDEELKKLLDYLSKKDKFIGDDIFGKYEHFLENFRNYLSTLSIEQTFSFLHIIFFITMILLVYNIAIIFYSDLIIKYLSIENRYPKFSRFIEIRRKFQRYYMT
jgi:hypothetical protein